MLVSTRFVRQPRYRQAILRMSIWKRNYTRDIWPKRSRGSIPNRVDTSKSAMRHGSWSAGTKFDRHGKHRPTTDGHSSAAWISRCHNARLDARPYALAYKMFGRGDRRRALSSGAKNNPDVNLAIGSATYIVQNGPFKAIGLMKSVP